MDEPVHRQGRGKGIHQKAVDVLRSGGRSGDDRVSRCFGHALFADQGFDTGIGVEYSKELNFDTYTSIRFGYNTKTKDISGLQGFTAGIGFKYFEYDFDYAYVPFGDLGQTHIISFSLKF